MTKKLNRVINLARLFQPENQNGRSWHVSAAYRKNKLIAVAWNDYSQLHLEHKYGKYKPTRGGENYQASLHSEISLAKKLKNKIKDLTIINVRLGFNGQPMLSAPCKNCERELNRLGFKRIYYTIDEKSYGVIEP